jgi:hypothetical protein
MLVVLASSTSNDKHLFEIVALRKPPSHQDWGRGKAAGSRFARDVKELGSQLDEAITRRKAS